MSRVWISSGSWPNREGNLWLLVGESANCVRANDQDIDGVMEVHIEVGIKTYVIE